MFWNAFKITLGICAALVGGYVLILVIAVLWIDGWFARHPWIWVVALAGPVLAAFGAIESATAAWYTRREKLPEPEPAAQPEPNRRAAKAATN